jgi:hypothetical protein
LPDKNWAEWEASKNPGISRDIIADESGESPEITLPKSTCQLEPQKNDGVLSVFELPVSTPRSRNCRRRGVISDSAGS